MNPEITVVKYKINLKSEKGFSLVEFGEYVINNTEIQVYKNKNKLYMTFK